MDANRREVKPKETVNWLLARTKGGRDRHCMTSPTCKVVPSGDAYVGQQGFSYLAGLTGNTVGSRDISMTVVTLPDGARAKTHLHRGIETAVYVLEGEAEMHLAKGCVSSCGRVRERPDKPDSGAIPRPPARRGRAGRLP